VKVRRYAVESNPACDRRSGCRVDGRRKRRGSPVFNFASTAREREKKDKSTEKREAISGNVHCIQPNASKFGTETAATTPIHRQSQQSRLLQESVSVASTSANAAKRRARRLRNCPLKSRTGPMSFLTQRTCH
jgi:hypothetical protein